MTFRGDTTLRWLSVAALAASCSTGDTTPPERVPLVVFAASSLAEAFGELERGFERANPKIDVQPTFAGSQVLRLQIEQGAPADVFASANEDHMGALVDAHLVTTRRTFARSNLAVIVPINNPAGIERFDQLHRASRIVIGTEHVPVGRYTRRLFERTKDHLGAEFVSAVQERVVSEESNVRLVRAKVELGEADAAVVYRTDATSSGRVRTVPIPAELNVQASFPIGTLARSRHPALVERFIAYVFSPEGRRALRHRGFVAGLE